MIVTLDHTQSEAPNIATFYFRPEREVAYMPGQYVELKLPHASMDDRGDRRLFALSSSPTEELISITNKFAGKDGSSFKRELARLKPGAQLEMSAPKGRFVLPQDVAVPLVFIAGGIGITPFRSMALWLAAQAERRNVRLFYGVNSETDALFLPILAPAIPEVTVIASNPKPAWPGERGYLHADFIVPRAAATPETLFYISGPEGLVQTLRKGLLAAGIQKGQLIVDLFTGYHAA